MKIVSWNCCQKFREKYKIIQKYNADIYIIQECEDPNLTKTAGYKEFSKNSIWIGTNKNKGLGIFAKDTIDIKQLNWESNTLRHFLPIRVDNTFNLIGVWACIPYIDEYSKYQQMNINHYDKHTIIFGDFNSNAIWDKKHSNSNHSNVVNQLNRIGLISAYHYLNHEQQGNETKNTFYLWRHKEKGFHIDHCFINKDYLIDYSVVDDERFLEFSDHMPIVLNCNF